MLGVDIQDVTHMCRFSSAVSIRLTSCSVRIHPTESAPQDLLSVLIKCGARVGQAALFSASASEEITNARFAWCAMTFIK
jgi:hypothetical protein